MNHLIRPRPPSRVRDIEMMMAYFGKVAIRDPYHSKKPLKRNLYNCVCPVSETLREAEASRLEKTLQKLVC